MTSGELEHSDSERSKAGPVASPGHAGRSTSLAGHAEPLGKACESVASERAREGGWGRGGEGSTAAAARRSRSTRRHRDCSRCAPCSRKRTFRAARAPRARRRCGCVSVRARARARACACGIFIRALTHAQCVPYALAHVARVACPLARLRARGARVSGGCARGRGVCLRRKAPARASIHAATVPTTAPRRFAHINPGREARHRVPSLVAHLVCPPWSAARQSFTW